MYAGVVPIVLLFILASLRVPDAVAHSAPAALTLAGCDANIPITRLLAQAFISSHPGLTVALRTVGSTNGIALAAAEAVHVGLTSRSLRDDEQSLGLTVRPYARTAVIIVTDPALSETNLTREDVLRLYRGPRARLRGGREVALLTREAGDSSIAALTASLPGFADAYVAGATMSHWTVLYSEPTMHEAVLLTPAALGLSDLGTVTVERLPIKMLDIDGVAPTLVNLESGRYPFVKTLNFVWRDRALPESARAFIQFVLSEEGARILRTNGYLPVPDPL